MNYVALDVGNVLVHVDFVPFVEALSRQLNITVEDANYFMSRTCRLHDLGLTCMEDELKNHFQIKSQVILKELLGLWNGSIWCNPQMQRKMCEWSSQKNVKIALLSNVGLEHVKVMEQILSLDKIPNLVRYFSCQVGARKPTSLYYQSFLQLHPEWTGCLYLDDLQENLDASVQFGFRPFHFALDKHAIGGNPDYYKMQDMEYIIIGK